ncbi:MAG: hypothetical protein EWM72_02074 [Nitrospira sp.]|nr:MAG: hypothetical protein EWM72_02074 [Nitrospira sp.]
MSDSSPIQPRLLLAGLHPMILEDSRLQFCDRYRIDTVNANEHSLLSGVVRLRPDVVLVDFLCAGSLKTITRIKEIRPSCHVLGVTGMRRAEVREAILSAGAEGVLYRYDAAAELAPAIDAVLSGQPYVSLAVTRAIENSRTNRLKQMADLTDLDRRVLHLIVRDYPAYRIAMVLGLPIGAVRLSIAHLKRRFNVRTKQELKHCVVTHALFSVVP